jgi:hypothetical protein
VRRSGAGAKSCRGTRAGFLDDEFDYSPDPSVKAGDNDDELPRVKEEDMKKDDMADYLALLAWQDQ